MSDEKTASDGTIILAAIADLKRSSENQATIFLAKVDGIDRRVSQLESKLGSPSTPPPGVVAAEAKATASSASLEVESVKGMFLALDSKVNDLAAHIEKNTNITTEIRDAIAKPLGAILSAKPVQAAAMAVLLAALGAAGALLQAHATGPVMVAPPAPVLNIEAGLQ